MKNQWEDIYSKKQEEAMMQFPFSIVIELINFHKRKYPNMKPEDINILEVGCGSGSNIRYLAGLGYNVYGIDISETAVNYAKNSFKKSNLTGHIETASVDKLPFQDNFFHVVIEHGVLMCVYEDIYIKAIDEIHRVMVGGGISLLTPKSEINSSNIRLQTDIYDNNYSFKNMGIYINNINLHAVIKILNNRFKVVFLRRNDRTNYTISDDNSTVIKESVDSSYHMFIEKI